jgi:hypothetical protein
VHEFAFRRRQVVAGSKGEERTRESRARDLSGISPSVRASVLTCAHWLSNKKLGIFANPLIGCLKVAC